VLPYDLGVKVGLLKTRLPGLHSSEKLRDSMSTGLHMALVCVRQTDTCNQVKIIIIIIRQLIRRRNMSIKSLQGCTLTYLSVTKNSTFVHIMSLLLQFFMTSAFCLYTNENTATVTFMCINLYF